MLRFLFIFIYWLPFYSFSDSIENSLVDRFQAISSYQADFVESIYSPKGDLIVKNKGILIYQKPYYFRYDITEPDPILIVSDGSDFMLYEKDLEQVTLYSINSALEDSLLFSLFSGRTDLLADYHISNKKNNYILTEKNEKAQFQTLNFSFDKRGLTALSYIDKASQKIMYTFKNRNFKQQKTDSFRLDIPKGVLVDDQRLILK